MSIRNIKITDQTNNNECGICVTKSLINYFYHENISKEELYNNVKIDENGISIFELENLLNQYKINAESYEANLDDLKTIPSKTPFVTLIVNQTGLHFVIAMIDKGKIHIYDSAEGKYEMDFQKFSGIWQNIIILVNKESKNIDLDFKVKKLIGFVDWRIFLINNSIQLIISFLSIISGLYMNNIINNVVNNQSLSNLITINIIFILVYFSNCLLNLFINHFNYKSKISYFNLINFKVKNKLINLDYQTLRANKLNDILEINDHIFSMSGFYSVTINKIFTDLFNCFISMILLSITSVWSILVLIIMSFVIAIVNYISFNIAKKSIAFNQNHQNQVTKNALSLVDNIKDNHYFELSNKLKNNWFMLDLKYNQKNYQFDYNNMLVKSFFDMTQSLFFIVLIAINIMSIFSHQLTLGKIFFIINLFQMFLSGLNNIFGFYLNIPNIQYSKEFLSRIINYELTENVGINLEEIKALKINETNFENDTVIFGKNGIGKSTLLKSFFTRNEHPIYFNDVSKDLINTNWIKKHLIYLSNNYCLDETAINNLLLSNYQELIVEVLNKAQINSLKDINSLSTGQKQILSFLSLILFENKVLLVDELLGNVSLEMKSFLYQKIKPLIIERNFLLVVDHEKKINHFFKNEYEVKQCIENH